VSREPGPLIASGRDADIFEFGRGLVLRKTRGAGRSLEREARAMQFVADAGYPVPAIHELRAGGTELVMERVGGPLMSDAILHAVWRQASYARMLADLHDQLHAIAAPEWLPQLDDGGSDLVHLDLHPLNVLMSTTRGPVVIDWPNARRGDPMADNALTFALLTCGHIPLPRPIAVALDAVRTPVIRRVFARRYLSPHFFRRVEEMAILKCLDTNMEPDELAALEKLSRWAAKRAG